MTLRKSPGKTTAKPAKTRRSRVATTQSRPSSGKPTKAAAATPSARTSSTFKAGTAAAKKPAAHKTAVQKTATVKAAAVRPKAAVKRKTAPTQPVAKKPDRTIKTTPARTKSAPAAKPAAKKTAKKKTVTETAAPRVRQTPASNPTVPAKKTAGKRKRAFTGKEIKVFYAAMLDLRNRLTNQVEELREQSLLRHDEVNQDEDGTDAFDRVTRLDRASIDQSQINQINTAIRMIEDGTYGHCENCGEFIERPRLQALPFAKTCIRCQSELEGGPIRHKPSIDLFD